MTQPRVPLDSFLASCREAGLTSGPPDRSSLAPAMLLRIHKDDWIAFGLAAKSSGVRWCGFWASETSAGYEAFSCLECSGTYIVVRTDLTSGEELSSLAEVFPSADRLERHSHDLLGLRFSNGGNRRRWTRHLAWSEHSFPLRRDFQWSASNGRTPPDHDYPFVPVTGAGVVEIPVGPVHAGIIEPGHFRFHAVGETILTLEERLGYVHKGIEKLGVGRDAEGLARLAGRVSGDCTVGHAWAACQAMERAAGLEVPPRGLALRALMTERERVANHLGDVAAICNDVGFAFAQYQLTRLREDWIRESERHFGHRLLMDRVVPGGALADIDEQAIVSLCESAHALGKEVSSLVSIIEESESVEDRLMGTGRLAPEVAAELGAVGFVGRASGQNFDVRRDAPYPPYDRLSVKVAGFRAGDIAARAKVRAEETSESLNLMIALLESLPPGPYHEPWRPALKACEGLGIVEGWRGEILTYVSFSEHGTVTRFFPRDPSWLTWPALEQLVHDNIVPDFPVCNKSINASYSGTDL